MTDPDVDEVPDFFTSEGECWAWKKTVGVIGATAHVHLCRELVDDHATHNGPHICCKCGTTF